jgi:hypothetical protein
MSDWTKPDIDIYCVKCKKFTETINGRIAETVNKKLNYKGKCMVCGFNKNRLISSKISGKGVFNSLFNTVGKIMPELHLKHETGEQVPNGSFNDKKTYSYAGPFTRLEQRLREGYQGVNDLDRASREHDLAYSKYKDTENRHKHDDILAQRAVDIAANSIDLQERKDAQYVAGIMSGKQRFGLGLKKKLVTIV